MKKFVMKLFFGIVMLSYGSLLHAATLVVPDNYPAIQTAIIAAVDGDDILVRNGTYSEDIDFNGKAITIHSENGAKYTTIDGTYAGNVIVTCNSGEKNDSVLDGFTIQNHYGSIGGIYCRGSSPTIKNCVITGNTTISSGAGILCQWSSNPIIINCTIANNTTNNAGGGIYCHSSSPTIINCTIVSNSAGSMGGGIYCTNASNIIITNCTIANNTAATRGGGIYCNYSSPIAVNSIFWGDKAGDAPNEISLNGGSTINVTYSDIEGRWPGAGNINVDPLFVDVANSDYHLQSTPISPCIDKGTDNTITHPNIPTGDIDGDLRPHDGNGNGIAQYDIGSDESIESTPLLLELGIDIITNQSSYTTGDTLTIQVRTTNDGTPDDVVEAIWLKLPNGNKVSYDLGIVSIPANDDTTTTILTYIFNGTEQAGEYKIGGRLADNTTIGQLSLDVEFFDFTP